MILFFQITGFLIECDKKEQRLAFTLANKKFYKRLLNRCHASENILELSAVNFISFIHCLTQVMSDMEFRFCSGIFVSALDL